MTKFINKDFLKEKLPNLADSTIKIYANHLKLLNDNNEPDSLDFLEDTDKIIQKLDKYSINTKKNYISSICSVLGTISSKRKLYEKYKYLLDENKILVEEFQNLTIESNKDSILEWSDIYELFQRQYEKEPLSRNTLICSFYVYQEPRRNLDYAKLIYNPFNECIEENYYDGLDFVFNKYKTVKTHGKQRIKVNENLRLLINQYMDKNNILPDDDIINIQPYNITKILNKIFGKTVCELRKVYLTTNYSFVKNGLNSLNETCSNMGTSQETALKSYIH